jgi:hypothetical protein
VTAGPAFAQVELRGGAFIEDEVTQVSAAGVTINTSDGPRTLGWDRVKRVAGEHEEHANQFASLSDDLWRATRRLERGDIGLAAPILERLWTAALTNQTDPQTIAGVRLAGPTGLALAEGVASVRVAQGRLAEAVEPWTVAIALRRAITASASTTDTAWLDPALPPIFVRSVAVERLASTEPPTVVLDDEVARTMFLLYRFAAARATGLETPAPVIAPTGLSDPDLRLVTDIVIMQGGNTALIAPARARLDEVVRSQANTWREAWARAALGIADVESETTSERLGGALELMHIPTRFASTQPYLTGVALAWASVALRREGDEARAAALIAELERVAPDHPAIGWLARSAGETR